MKKLWILPIGLVVAIIAAALFAGCSLPQTKTSVDDCINNFMSDLNSSDRSNVYTNLDSTSLMYSQVKTATYWNSIFPTGYTYTLSNKSTSGSTVTATLSSSYTLYSSGVPITFIMSTDLNGNAVIHSITISTSTSLTVYQ
jgi:hypothetical protein